METSSNPFELAGLLVNFEFLPIVILTILVLPFVGLWYGIKNENKILTIISALAIILMLLAVAAGAYFIYALSQVNWSL